MFPLFETVRKCKAIFFGMVIIFSLLTLFDMDRNIAYTNCSQIQFDLNETSDPSKSVLSFSQDNSCFHNIITEIRIISLLFPIKSKNLKVEILNLFTIDNKRIIVLINHLILSTNNPPSVFHNHVPLLIAIRAILI